MPFVAHSEHARENGWIELIQLVVVVVVVLVMLLLVIIPCPYHQ